LFILGSKELSSFERRKINFSYHREFPTIVGKKEYIQKRFLTPFSKSVWWRYESNYDINDYMDIANIKKKINPILKRNGVKKAAVFGSIARNDANKVNDIDLLIEFRKNDKSLFDLSGLKIELEEKLNKKVDILTYDSLHPLLKDIILSEQKIIL
jgi:predicted nucleotidyltransferase